MPRVRVHQHVNPLSPYYLQPPAPLKVEKVFEHPKLPLFLDIGAARGRFILKMAEIEKDKNFFGVEIREPLVEEANRIAEERKLNNLHYEFCNAMVALDKLLVNLPENLLETATIQFPDPWFKKKHSKRRMVNAKMAETIAVHMKKGGRVFVQTDIDFLAEEMFEIFRNNSAFIEEQISENPFPVKTEREMAVEEKDLPVFRAIFIKK